MAGTDDFFEELGRCYYDPLRFVLWAFPWGETPELSIVKLPEPWASKYPGCEYGPDAWACEILEEVGRRVQENGFDGVHAVPPVQVAISSGHGIGKSFLTACIVIWIMATRPGSKGVVTANTAAQLETKTWAEITKWLKRSLVADMFDIKATSIVAKESPEAWRVDALTCREENSESFAGQHAASASSFYIFDEASAVPDKIWEVAEGGLTDGEPFMFVFGNPTRNTGRFRECFGKRRARWITRQIDSRTVAITNKRQIEEWKNDYGEDSDFFRVRVRGLFPNASSSQFIPTGLAESAAAREASPNHNAYAAILGVDVARFGDDDTVMYARFGKDATLKPRVYHGLKVTETVAYAKGFYNDLRRMGFKKVYIFVDDGGVGGGVVDMLKDDGFPARGVNFGASADDKERYSRKREEMWGLMREWLEEGVIVSDQRLIEDLTSPEYSYTLSGQIKLESKEDMKKRGLSSPDMADALAITFAYKVKEYESEGPARFEVSARRNYDPFSVLKGA